MCLTNASQSPVKILQLISAKGLAFAVIVFGKVFQLQWWLLLEDNTYSSSPSIAITAFGLICSRDSLDSTRSRGKHYLQQCFISVL